jgi:hypothetical protein
MYRFEHDTEKNDYFFLKKETRFLCSVDRASRYISVIKTHLMHYLSSVYFLNQPVHFSGIFVAHHREVYCILPVCRQANRQSTEKHKTYQLLYIHSILPDYGLQICPKHVEVD